MNDIASERFGIALSKRLCADCFELAGACDAAPENIVLAPGIDADNSPHLVVVWWSHEVRVPDNVDDCQIVRAIQGLERTVSRFAQHFQNRSWIRDRPRYHFSHALLRATGRERHPAISDEFVEVKGHADEWFALSYHVNRG